jgi:hypothetical protein
MPNFPYSQALTANQLGFDPLTNWQFRYLPWDYYAILYARATGTSVRLTVYAGSTTIQQRAPIQAGGTAGTTPSALNTEPVDWFGGAGDIVLLQHDEVGGLTPTVDGLIKVNPA